MRKMNKSMFCMVFFLITACGNSKNGQEEESVPDKAAASFEVRMTLEHDPNAFTQGLVYYNNKLIESTGGDNSWIAEYDIATGKYERKVTLDNRFFGEGITVLNNKLYQLTWESNIGFVYDINTYQKLGEFTYDFEGWGITHDNQHLIISDGTDKLHYFDTLTLNEDFVKSVKFNDQKASRLNELEFIEGYIYANQWEANYILKIDTATAEVVEVLDFGHLAEEAIRKNPNADVLNGIAYNPNTRDVYITGKLWPHLYIVRFRN